MKLFIELNPTRDEWCGQWGTGVYLAGWCLIGIYVMLPKYYALVIFNVGMGVFIDD